MKRNTPEFISRSKMLCKVLTSLLGEKVCVQITTGSIYSVAYGIITEIPGGFGGWDYCIQTDEYSCIKFSIDDVVDSYSGTIFLGKR